MKRFLIGLVVGAAVVVVLLGRAAFTDPGEPVASVATVVDSPAVPTDPATTPEVDTPRAPGTVGTAGGDLIGTVCVAVGRVLDDRTGPDWRQRAGELLGPVHDLIDRYRTDRPETGPGLVDSVFDELAAAAAESDSQLDDTAVAIAERGRTELGALTEVARARCTLTK